MKCLFTHLSPSHLLILCIYTTVDHWPVVFHSNRNLYFPTLCFLIVTYSKVASYFLLYLLPSLCLPGFSSKELKEQGYEQCWFWLSLFCCLFVLTQVDNPPFVSLQRSVGVFTMAPLFCMEHSCRPIALQYSWLLVCASQCWVVKQYLETH